MAYENDYYSDLKLAAIKADSEVLHICSAEPSTFAGVAGVTLGNKASPTIADPSDRSGGGREIVVATITDGSVTGTGTASHWALVNTTSSRLIAANALSASQAVTSGNTFTTAAFAVGSNDAVSV